MFYLFLGCAAFGGAIMLAQMLLTLIGLTGDSLHVDMPHDVGGHDAGGDFHGDAGGAGHGDPGSNSADAHHDAEHGAASTLFKMLSVRTIVAAIAFFGLAGAAARRADYSSPAQLLIALAAGGAAMYAVFHLFQFLYTLRSEGNVRIARAIGQEATVYLRIPGQRRGMGKVHVNVQNRIMEYSALTPGPDLPTGAKVAVVNVISDDTLEVKSLAVSRPVMSDTQDAAS